MGIHCCDSIASKSNVCQTYLRLTIDTLDIMPYTLDIVATNIEQSDVEVTMATSALRELAGSHDMLDRHQNPLHGQVCARCGGLIVGEFCMDLLNGADEWNCPIGRCVQCGDIVDPVILRNRQLSQRQAVPDRSSKAQPGRRSVETSGSAAADTCRVSPHSSSMSREKLDSADR